jgi:hypothetical protein
VIVAASVATAAVAVVDEDADETIKETLFSFFSSPPHLQQ